MKARMIVLAITSKERIEASRKRKEEYRQMRDALLKIALASDTTNTDRIAAISTIYRIDTDGIPYPNNY